MRTSNLPGKLHATLMMLFCIALVAASPAAAQKKGGTLRLYHNDNPPSTSLLEEVDHRLGDAVCGRLQQSRDVRSRQGPRKHRDRHSRSRRKLVVGSKPTPS